MKPLKIPTYNEIIIRYIPSPIQDSIIHIAVTYKLMSMINYTVKHSSCQKAAKFIKYRLFVNSVYTNVGILGYSPH